MSDDEKTEVANSKKTEVKNETKKDTVETKYESKIEKQMKQRGWNKSDVENTIKNGKQESAIDSRHNPKTGTQNNTPATRYTNSDGSYIVRNNETGDVVQVSNKNKADWIPHGKK